MAAQLRPEDLQLQGGAELARRCVQSGVLENQLSMIVAHLRRHKSLDETLKLVRALPGSVFAMRTNRTRTQLTGLSEHVGRALERASDWQEAARIVGWARRLAVAYRHRSG
jgi:hypothetical protein